MKGIKVVPLVLFALMLTVTGCGRHHYGYGHGGGYGAERGVQEMNALVERVVKDPDKAKQAKEIVSEIVAEVRESYKQNRAYHEQLYQLNADYQAGPEGFTKILDDLNNARMRTATKILALRFKMKDLLTADEWKALTDEMNTIRSRYRHAEKKEDGEGGKGTR